MRTGVMIVAALAMLAVPPGRSAEGRIPIFEPVLLDGAGGAISGRYVLARDIEVADDVVAIDVVGTGTEAIDIDLNGFTVRGGATADAAIRVRGAGINSFVLRNGKVVGAMFEDCDGNFIDRNVLRTNGGAVPCKQQNAEPPCAAPAVCDEGTNNTSFGDNIGPDRGC